MIRYRFSMSNILEHAPWGSGNFIYLCKSGCCKSNRTGRLGPSALIGLQAVLIGLALGLILGVLAAWKHNSGIDYFTMILAVLGVSVPNFVAAALLQYFIGLKWGVLPIAFWTSWSCSILPSIALIVLSALHRWHDLCVRKCWMFWIRIIS